jgi:hypothetical protein
MRAAVLLTVAVISGCAAQPTYYHPHKTQADFDRDKYGCHQEAVQYAANLGFHGNPLIVNQQAHECMVQKHGYTTTAPSAPAEPTAKPKPRQPTDPDSF